MKLLICLSLFVWGASALILGLNDVKDGVIEPEYLDSLLAEKKYEEFSKIMGIPNPELAYSKGEYKTRFQAMFSSNKKGLRQGDILMSPLEEARQAIKLEVYGGNKWQNGRVPFVIAKNATFSRDELNTIYSSINRWNEVQKCIKVVPRTTEKDYIFIFNGDGCWSRLGKTGGPQPLSLEKQGCTIQGTVLHEMNHAIGVGHEQNRIDRDEYVEILWHNIPEDWHSQYALNDPKIYGIQGPYDYMSIMHYPLGSPVGEPNKPAMKILKDDPNIDLNTLGWVKDFTKIDLGKVNKLYC